jgi:uncharacterized protein (TIGR03435 family)
VSPCAFGEGPEFEVASIKPYVQPSAPLDIEQLRRLGVHGGPGSNEPTRVMGISVRPMGMVLEAFGVEQYRIDGVPVGPQETPFDIEALVPLGATKEQVREMWRNLLVSRFHMKYHVEQREFPVDELVIAPRGHKLKENGEASSADSGPAPSFDAQGRLQLSAPGITQAVGGSQSGIAVMIVARAQPIDALLPILSEREKHPIVNKTGLTDKYDYYLSFTPSNMMNLAVSAQAGDGPAPKMLTGGVGLNDALQEQLGLRLVKGKGKLDVIIVDHLDPMPTEN